MLSVVCWAWQGGGRVYRPEHVNRLAEQVREHLAMPHRFVCITDYTTGFAPGVEAVPTPKQALWVANLPTLEGRGFPSCMRRLWVFSRDAAALGDRLLCLDVDTLITGPLDPLVDRPEEFVGWRPLAGWPNRNRFGGGMYLLTAGARAHVWEGFRGRRSMVAARRAGFRGSDQAWISHCLWGREAMWGDTEGIYSIRDLERMGHTHAAPADARVIHYNGKTKPWQANLPWVREHWNGRDCRGREAVDAGLPLSLCG